eukprot:snap_masked-scaffold_49-processed-gene-1.78-mRNA-1 protein AED:1.00 eAED:1.00 QI:0/0/0/0/1/1/2/0/105
MEGMNLKFKLFSSLNGVVTFIVLDIAAIIPSVAQMEEIYIWFNLCTIFNPISFAPICLVYGKFVLPHKTGETDVKQASRKGTPYLQPTRNTTAPKSKVISENIVN